MYIILGGRTACWPHSLNAEGHNEIQQYRLNNFKPIGNLSLFLVKHRKMRDLHITKPYVLDGRGLFCLKSLFSSVVNALYTGELEYYKYVWLNLGLIHNIVKVLCL